MKTIQSISRRKFLTGTTFLLAGTAMKLYGFKIPDTDSEPIIDIHVHLNHGGRTGPELLAHQRAMGVTTSILLPAGREVNTASTHYGESNGLGGNPLMLGNEDCYNYAQQHPEEFHFGVNEVPDLPDTIQELEKYLKLGAKIIGESKFAVECDSPEMQRIYELAQSYEVPVLMHWQHERYNYGFERFYKMLEKYPKVNFIGHAQTFWANIDKDHHDQSVMYPRTKVTPGGITDRLLSDYPNMFGDLSAGSGLNSLTRDEDHAREFLDRHQNKLMYGSDDTDSVGSVPDCRGAEAIATIRRLSPTREIERKVLYENAKKLLRL